MSRQGASVETLQLMPLKIMGGADGQLVALEAQRQVPFEILRAYYIWDVPVDGPRGRHAHHRGHQFFVCLRGACRFTCDDGTTRRDFVLESPDVGLHVPPMIWGEQTYLSTDTIALVFADQLYDRSDYIEDYQEFVQLTTAG